MKEAAQNEKIIRIQGKEVRVSNELPVRVACMEHVERELDDYVDHYEVAPDTFKAADVEDESVERKCQVCGAEGDIVLLHVKGM